MKLQLLSADSSVRVTVDSFPFTIGRNLPEFQGPDKRSTLLLESLRHISRKHATFILDGNKIFVVDEDALNGTTVDGHKLGDKPLEIHSKSVICLADRLSLIVDIENSVVKDEQKVIENDLTVYVDEATSFMKVLSDNNKIEFDYDKENKKENSINKKHKKIINIYNNYALLIKVICIFSFIIASIFLYLYNFNTQDKIENYIKIHKYNQAVSLANSYLSDKDKPNIQDIGRTAVIKNCLKELGLLLDGGVIIDFNKNIEKIKNSSTSIKDSDVIIEAISFIAETEFFFNLGLSQENIRNEQWQNQIKAINKKWIDKKHSYHPVINEIEQISPSFVNTTGPFFSHLNESRELELYEIDQLDELDREVGTALKQKNYDKVWALIKEYDQKHPHFPVGKDLQRDVSSYVMLESIAEEHKAEEAYSYIRDVPLQATVVKQLAEEYIKMNFPPQPILRLLADATKAWESGLPQKGLAMMKSIPDNPWSDFVSERIMTYQSMFDQMALIENTPESREKCKAICKLYKLAGKGDEQYTKRYEQEFTICRSGIESKVEKHMAKAMTLFGQYIQQGGISGQMRMEQAITDSFRSQAELLAEAYGEAGRAKFEMLELGEKVFEHHKSGISRITGEYEKQCSRLSESTVLSSGLKQGKIDLLKKGKTPGNE